MAHLLKESMRIDITMEGTVNGHHFKCKGEGQGNPFKGIQEVKIRVVEGAPLPFAYDVLATCASYGGKTFVQHESGIPDYFKQSFPEGFTWERTTAYDDGGFLTAQQDTSLKGDCLIYKVKILGTNFPADGPVMRNKSEGWEPSREVLYVDNGVLCGQSLNALKIGDNRHLIAHLHSTYRSKKPAGSFTMPGYHFDDYRIQLLSQQNGEHFHQYEKSVARYSDLPKK